MALTATTLQRLSSAYGYNATVVKAVGDTSYPTGGYAVTPALFGFNAFATDGLGTGLPPTLGNYAILGDAMGTPDTWYSAINPANGNLQLFVTTTGVEVAAAVNVSTFAVVLEALGY